MVEGYKQVNSFVCVYCLVQLISHANWYDIDLQDFR